MKYISIKNLVLLNVFLCTTLSFGQSSTKIEYGADLVSRYIWRGIQLSDAPAIQPYIELNNKNFAFGVWGSYHGGSKIESQEFDLYASYTMGSFSIGFTDYSFPVDVDSDGYFKSKNHIGEIMLSKEQTENFPFSVSVASNVYNDDKNSVYTSISRTFKLGNTEGGLFIGAGNNLYSTTNNFEVINFGFSTGKEIQISEQFQIKTTASIIFNPDTDDAYFVLSLSI